MIINSYEFKVEKKLHNKSIWCCLLKDRIKCKARCITYGKTLELKGSSHNHECTYKRSYQNLSSQILNIFYGRRRQKLE